MEKIKIPFTVRLLIDLYEIKQKIGDITFAMKLKPLRDIMLPEYVNFLRGIKKGKERRNFQKTIDRLIRRGYLRRIQGNKNGVIITKHGLSRILKFKNYKNYAKRKDGRYQMVAFDIPEKLHKIRDLFRKELKILGFNQLQQSIWISPYDNYKELKEISDYYKIEEYTRYFLIQEQELI